MPEVGKFQVFGAKSWSGFTTKNHIQAIYGSSPQKASNIVTKLLSENYAPTLDSMLSKFPVKYFDSDDEFTWDLVGALERNYPLVEARAAGSVVASGDTGVGAAGEQFELVFAEKAFHDVNVIVGEKNEEYLIRVLEDPTPEGANWVYVVELMGANIDGMPGSELVAGKRFSKEYSPVESTMSVKGGDIGFTSNISLRNEFSKIRMQHTAPGNMKNLRPMQLPIAFTNPKTDKVETATGWMDHVEWKFDYEFSMEKSRLMMFARTNRDSNGDYYNIGKSGHVLQMGSGIREQMEVSNTKYYNTFTIALIENMLTELSEGKLGMDERHFVLRTGERGAMQFNKAARTEANGWVALGFANNDATGFQKVSSPLHQNAYSAGFQIVEWLAPNNIKVTLEVDKFYDNKVRNKILHPDGGVAESYRYDILDIGTVDGEPNIQKAMVRGEEDIRGWEVGLRNPFPSGVVDGSYMSHSVDGSTYHRMCTVGAFVRDPSRTASLIPSILAA